jgi:hypothetical protein
MKPWQRNRFALVAVMLASVVTLNIPSLTTAQILSLIAAYLLLFFLYVKFFNRYQK